MRYAAIGAACVAALFLVVLATRPSALEKQASSPLLGKPAAEIAGASVVSGEAVRLSDLRGRWVLVNFFATWCVPCRKEHPELVKFSQRHLAAADAQVVMVIYDDRVKDVQAWFKARGGSWPVIDDPDGRVALAYGVRGVPESFLVDPQGFIVSKLIGGVTADGLESLLARAKRRGV